MSRSVSNFCGSCYKKEYIVEVKKAKLLFALVNDFRTLVTYKIAKKKSGSRNKLSRNNKILGSKFKYLISIPHVMILHKEKKLP